jgi:hypothetical protein
MEDKVKKVMSDVFNIDVSLINNESSPDNIENWDSLKHMNLIIAQVVCGEEHIRAFSMEMIIKAAKNKEPVTIRRI